MAATEPRQEMVHLVTVYPPEDLIITGVLQTAGIQVIARRESIAPVEGITIGPLAEVKIYVPREQEAAARAALAAAREDN